MKQRCEGQDEADSAKKRCVEYATFQKWQRDLDHELQMMSWLYCIAEKQGARKVVAKLKCKVCSDFADRIRGRKNFSDKWIVKADLVRISNVCDHARTD